MAKNFLCTATEPVVQTKAGKIRGFKLDSTYTFYGIKYADAKRFQAPTPVEPWEGIKDALSYGHIAPLLRPGNPGGDLKVPHRFWPESEDCQYINVWTQSLDPEAKKPVLVWIHGGGFESGSSIEMVAYDGDNLSKNNDVVVTSINHRLNIFGFLDMSPYGKEYENSCNAGMADVVAALQWIHDNIQNFGGDPENVTIFGQSGGGGKVLHLMQIPAAAGLFHRAVAQSGVMKFGPKPTLESHAVYVKKMLRELGSDDPLTLTTIPTAELIRVCNAVAEEMLDDGYSSGWVPIANGWYLGNPLEVGFSEHAKKIPMMLGTVFGEMAFGTSAKGKTTMTEAEKMEKITAKYGENTEKVLDLFKKAYPDHDILDSIFLDSAFRAPNIEYNDARSKVAEAPTYSYMFAYDLPVDDGTPAWHCAEIPFVFQNTDKVAVANEVGVTDRLEAEVSSAWVNFARTGNPNNELLPEWKNYTLETPVTMVFDVKTEAKSDYDRELANLHWEVAPMPMRRR